MKWEKRKQGSVYKVETLCLIINEINLFNIIYNIFYSIVGIYVKFISAYYDFQIYHEKFHFNLPASKQQGQVPLPKKDCYNNKNKKILQIIKKKMCKRCITLLVLLLLLLNAMTIFFIILCCCCCCCCCWAGVLSKELNERCPTHTIIHTEMVC